MIGIEMQMPLCCLNCLCARPYYDSPFFDVWCVPLERYIDEKQSWKRQEDCPLADGDRKGEDRMCGTCKHDEEGWESEACDSCTGNRSNWERKEND